MTHPIALRPLRVEDAPAMARVLADPALYAFTGGEPPTVEDLTRRYTTQTRGGSTDGTETWVNEIVVLATDGRPIGYVQATLPHDGGPAEVAWVIGTPWQGQGFARRAAELLVAGLRARGVERALAHIHPHHVASQRIARHLGLAPTDTVVDGEVRWEGPLTQPPPTAAPSPA